MASGSAPNNLSIDEIRDFIRNKGGNVTNSELVKHFKVFLTNPSTQDEARTQFKAYVNTLCVTVVKGKKKYLKLREMNTKQSNNQSTNYGNNDDGNDDLESIAHSKGLLSPGSRSTISEHGSFSFSESPYKAEPSQSPTPPPQLSTMINPDIAQFYGSKSFLPHIELFDHQSNKNPPQPPPYKPPPDVVIGHHSLASETKEQYKDCVDEFKSALESFESASKHEKYQPATDNSCELKNNDKNIVDVSVTGRKRSVCSEKVSNDDDGSVSSDKNCENSDDANKENIHAHTLEKQISVKEAMQKFNQIAFEEEEAAKITSPPAKKKAEKKSDEMSNDNLLSSHPKSKEWIVSAARANYQELAKLSSEYPELVKLQDPTTGYTALHWAAKHGNEDIVKLIAGTHKGNVNARTNGGYTPLHLAMQFGKDNIFELLCNVYKADRDILDWSGKKPLDYRKIHTTVSASTYSKIKARKKHSEKDLRFPRIGSLNVRVKKTTEAFSNFLGVGNNQHRIPATYMRSSVPPQPSTGHFDKVHKTWGSADNIPQSKKNDNIIMPPPASLTHTKLHTKRRSKHGPSSLSSTPATQYCPSGFRSVPTTPNQPRSNSIGTVSEHPKTESDSDSACGFDSNWK